MTNRFLTQNKLMKCIHYSEIEAQKVPEVPDVSIRWVISRKDGAKNFVMRVFELPPGAKSPRHKHDWEHEVFILEGKGKLFYEGNEYEFAPGYVIFVEEGREHQFINTGDETLKFICLIPTKGCCGK